MSPKIRALEKRTLTMQADGDDDVPDALRMIAKELEDTGGSLVTFDVAEKTLDGSFDPGVNPADLSEDEEEPQAPDPQRRDLLITVEIRQHIER